MLFEIKRNIRLLQRNYRDRKNRIWQQMQLQKVNHIDLPYQIELIQPIMQSAYFEAKLHNIQVCCEKLSHLVLETNQIFSFWNNLGAPTLKNGFQKGRMLKNGRLLAEVGGGICQAACIIYHCALQAGLRILERHCHSIDIYEEHERFTPLGADATVVHGFKDLRIQNPYPFPISIYLEVKEHQLICRFFSAFPLEVKKLNFDRIYAEKQIIVETNELKSNNQKACIAMSFYGKKS